MARSSRQGIIITLLLFVAIAIVIRVYAEPLYDMLLSLHGRPAAGH